MLGISVRSRSWVWWCGRCTDASSHPAAAGVSASAVEGESWHNRLQRGSPTAGPMSEQPWPPCSCCSAPVRTSAPRPPWPASARRSAGCSAAQSPRPTPRSASATAPRDSGESTCRTSPAPTGRRHGCTTSPPAPRRCTGSAHPPTAVHRARSQDLHVEHPAETERRCHLRQHAN